MAYASTAGVSHESVRAGCTAVVSNAHGDRRARARDGYVHPDEARLAACRRVCDSYLVVENIYPGIARRFLDAGISRFAEIGRGRGPIATLLADHGVAHASRTVSAMRVVLLGGAPGVGKTVAARELLGIAATGERLVQWVDVDALWLHQPWRVDDRTKAMVESNLRCVLANSLRAGVNVVVVTWVFQNQGMHSLVRALLPDGASVLTIQLLASEERWRERFEGDGDRPAIDDFFLTRYAEAQATPADHRLDTNCMRPHEVAAEVAHLVGITPRVDKGRAPGAEAAGAVRPTNRPIDA